MKYFYMLCGLLAGCHVTRPMVLPDTTRPSVMEETIKHNAELGSSTSYFWVLWYIPIAVVIMSWTWKTFYTKGKT